MKWLWKLFKKKPVIYLPLCWYCIKGKWVHIVTNENGTYIDGKLAEAHISGAYVEGLGQVVWLNIIDRSLT